MKRSTQWLSLLGGCLVMVYGLIELFRDAKWILLILGLLIVAFTVSNMMKTRQDEK